MLRRHVDGGRAPVRSASIRAKRILGLRGIADMAG